MSTSQPHNPQDYTFGALTTGGNANSGATLGNITNIGQWSPPLGDNYYTPFYNPPTYGIDFQKQLQQQQALQDTANYLQVLGTAKPKSLEDTAKEYLRKKVSAGL
jgi:hypothetical protein